MSRTNNRYTQEFKEQMFLNYLHGYSLEQLSKEFGIPLGTVKRWQSVYKWAERKEERKKQLEQQVNEIYDIGAKEEFIKFVNQYAMLNTKLFQKMIEILDSNIDIVEAKDAKAFFDTYLKAMKDYQDILRIRGAKAQVDMTVDGGVDININTDEPLDFLGLGGESHGEQ